jgi:hypothetical protein
MGWTKRLKLQRSMGRDRAPELDPDTAWVYSKGIVVSLPLSQASGDSILLLNSLL